jgi:low affinity Fe/Cu permease
MSRLFQGLVRKSAEFTGSPAVFNWAFGGIVVWALVGPRFHFDEAWQLFINTLTTILTFVLAFLLQASQRRHARRLQLKLDELLRAYCIIHARQRLIKLEEAPEEELRELQTQFKALRLRNPQA